MSIPLDPRFIPAFSIEDVLLDKDTGAPLSGGLVYFEYDDQRGLLKPIYQIIGASPAYTFTQLPNPMTLSSIGTFEDALGNPVIPYFYPYDANGDVELYYVRVTNADDVPQFVREAQPYISFQENADILSVITNEISNPQFSEVLFDTSIDSYTFSVNAVTNEVISIAPDWDLIVSAAGAGTVTVSQLTPVGSLNLITNPGTLLTIDSGGLSKLQLRQRIYGSPNLWGSGYLSASFVAKTYSGTGVTVNMYYSQSNGSVVDQLLVSAALPSSGAYAPYPGTALIPESNSSQDFPDAYIDIYFDLPRSIQIDITSIMLAFTGGTSITDITYDQESWARQIDHLFHYYKPQLEYKPIPNYLLGWDFPFNPCQELGYTVAASGLAANKSRYIADQTIAFEEAANVLSYAFTDSMGLTVSTASPTQFALIQYLEAASAIELLQANTMAVKLNGSMNSTTLKGYVNIYWTADAQLPNVAPGTNASLVSGLTLGVPTTANGTWVKVERDGLGDASFTLQVSPTDINISGWDAQFDPDVQTATYLAIVISFQQMSAAQEMTLRYCTLCSGAIATDPSPLNKAQTLAGLQYLYESSYNTGVPVGTVTTATEGACQAPMAVYTVGGTTTTWGAAPFGLRYISVKRETPVNTFWTPLGLVGNVRAAVYVSGTFASDGNASISLWVSENDGYKGIVYNPVSATASASFAGITQPQSAKITYHYASDSRFGIVL